MQRDQAVELVFKSEWSSPISDVSDKLRRTWAAQLVDALEALGLLRFDQPARPQSLHEIAQEPPLEYIGLASLEAASILAAKELGPIEMNDTGKAHLHRARIGAVNANLLLQALRDAGYRVVKCAS